MAPPPSPRELVDDVIPEILLRLPPDGPEWLFRAAVVCKAWLRTLSDPAFLSRYRDFHGPPPLLGLFNAKAEIEGSVARRFIPTTAVVPAFPESDGAPYAWPLDCRHGRVLFRMYGGSHTYYLVCDPVTGDRRRVPHPEIRGWTPVSPAAVICNAAGCDHLDCHGGPFSLVCLFSDFRTISAAMYSSEIGTWTAPVMLQDVPHVACGRGPLIGDGIYFALFRDAAIVKYDCANNFFSVVEPQPPAMLEYERFALMVMEDRSLGLAGIEDCRLHLWSRRVSSDESAQWVQFRVIDLEKMMPMGNPRDLAAAVGFAEGVGVIFIDTRVGLFLIELRLGRVRKIVC